MKGPCDPEREGCTVHTGEFVPDGVVEFTEVEVSVAEEVDSGSKKVEEYGEGQDEDEGEGRSPGAMIQKWREAFEELEDLIPSWWKEEEGGEECEGDLEPGRMVGEEVQTPERIGALPVGQEKVCQKEETCGEGGFCDGCCCVGALFGHGMAPWRIEVGRGMPRPYGDGLARSQARSLGAWGSLGARRRNVRKLSLALSGWLYIT